MEAQSQPQPEVLYEVRDHIAVITLNRPDARNAVNKSLANAAGAALDSAAHDPDVRCVVLTGAGPAFCAGAASLPGEGAPAGAAEEPGRST